MDKRQRAVREYLLGGRTYLQLEKKYDVSRATLNRCVLKYQARQQAKLKGVGLSSDPMKPKPNQPPSLEQLQKLLEQEQLRNKLLNAMLDIAEDELQVPIRKLIVQQVLLHRALQPRLGIRKLLVLMQDFVREHELKLGRDALFDLLRFYKLLVKKRRHLIREYVLKAPNSLWVSDITYSLP